MSGYAAKHRLDLAGSQPTWTFVFAQSLTTDERQRVLALWRAAGQAINTDRHAAHP